MEHFGFGSAVRRVVQWRAEAEPGRLRLVRNLPNMGGGFSRFAWSHGRGEWWTQFDVRQPAHHRTMYHDDLPGGRRDGRWFLARLLRPRTGPRAGWRGGFSWKMRRRGRFGIGPAMRGLAGRFGHVGRKIRPRDRLVGRKARQRNRFGIRLAADEHVGQKVRRRGRFGLKLADVGRLGLAAGGDRGRKIRQRDQLGVELADGGLVGRKVRRRGQLRLGITVGRLDRKSRRPGPTQLRITVGRLDRKVRQPGTIQLGITVDGLG
ncbi:MAG TPA: hypothetical protein VJX10_08445, partial [Pseudonocardiaceae bacterium]|nr:hypothetical protein [Pseudonocardiaceae bacterium]